MNKLDMQIEGGAAQIPDTSSQDEALLSASLPSSLHGGRLTFHPSILAKHECKVLPQVCLTSASPTDSPLDDYEYDLFGVARLESCCR